jgi:hypothetical protein
MGRVVFMFLKYIWEGLLGGLVLVVVLIVVVMFWFGDVNVIMLWLWLCWLMFDVEDVFELENEFNHWFCK